MDPIEAPRPKKIKKARNSPLKNTVEVIVPKSKSKKPTKKHNFGRVFFVSLGTFVLVGGIFTGYVFFYQHRILPHTFIAGRPVGGLTLGEADQAIQTSQSTFLKQQLALRYGVKQWNISPQEINLTFNNQSALSQAYIRGKQGTIWQQTRQLFSSLVLSHYFETDLSSVPATGRTVLSSKILESIENQPQETTLSFVPGNVSIIEGKAGKKLDYTDFDSQLYQSYKHGTAQINLSLITFQPSVSVSQAEPAQAQAAGILNQSWHLKLGSSDTVIAATDLASWLTSQPLLDTNDKATGLEIKIKDDGLKKYIANLVKNVDKSPVNAQLQNVNNIVTAVVPDQPGIKTDIDGTMQALKTGLLASATTGSITGVVQADLAPIRQENLAAIGINQLIGTGTTDFSGSPSNRVANITTGERMITGQVVKDGEEFSTIKALGPIDQAHGYVQGLVIINNQTIPADGGGLCQVSTTFFRAVLNAGLPVTARTSHSYEVSYYQRGIGPGLDATIYDPNPDFKWKNDTGHDIYIQGTIKGTKITFDLYGTSDGRTAVIDGPHTLQTYDPSGDPLYVNTATLPKGTTQMIDPPVQGARTTASYTVSRAGQVINKQTFNSFYQAMPAQYLVGTR